MKPAYTITIIAKMGLSVLFLLILNTTVRSQSDSTTINDRISIGAGMGLNFPVMRYSDPDLSDYRSSFFVRGALGIFAEYEINNHVSVRPELYYLGRGQLIDDQGVYYRFASTYFDWRLPVLYHFGPIGDLQPYVMLAPSISFAAGGKVSTDNHSVEISRASVYPVDIQFRLGVGVKKSIKINDLILIAGAQAAYDIGLVNTYSVKERNGTANAVNRAFYSIDGTRKNRGLEVTASLSFPLRNLKILFSEKKTVNPEDPQEIVDGQEKPNETKKPEEQLKPCYSLEEINVLISNNEDVNNKVICMNNLNFEFGKSTLDKETKKYLDEVVALLNKVVSMKMNISGHTDNVGKEEYNLDLSKKRAEAVHHYLISKGISAEKIAFDFFGSSKPLVPNDSDENRAKNRRVEFKIIGN